MAPPEPWRSLRDALCFRDTYPRTLDFLRLLCACSVDKFRVFSIPDFCKIDGLQQGVVVHALNLCTGEVEAGRELCEFETSLVCLQSEFQASQASRDYVVRPLFEERVRERLPAFLRCSR